MDSAQSLCHTKWDCKYHVVWIPKYRRKVLYGRIRKHIAEYLHELARQKESKIKKQEDEDNRLDQLSLLSEG